MKKFFSLVIIFACAFLLSGCKEGNATIEVTDVNIFLRVGETKLLQVKTNNPDKYTVALEIVDQAIVSAEGLVIKGEAEGETIVKAYVKEDPREVVRFYVKVAPPLAEIALIPLNQAKLVPTGTEVRVRVRILAVLGEDIFADDPTGAIKLQSAQLKSAEIDSAWEVVGTKSAPAGTPLITVSQARLLNEPVIGLGVATAETVNDLFGLISRKISAKISAISISAKNGLGNYTVRVELNSEQLDVIVYKGQDPEYKFYDQCKNIVDNGWSNFVYITGIAHQAGEIAQILFLEAGSFHL